MKHSIALCLWALAALASDAPPRQPLRAPAARNQTAGAFDEARGELVLFGGGDGSGRVFHGDTWTRANDAWKQRAATGPAPRACHAMVYDAHRGRIVLFGGENATRSFEDTWEWDGHRWLEVATTGPPARSCHQLAFDRERNVVVLFGGWDGPATRRLLGDTWEWNGTKWRLVAAAGPAARMQFAFAYDAARHASVLYGGMSAPSGAATRSFDDVWLWNGRAWTESKTPGPPARNHHALAADAARGRLVVFGGWNGRFLDDLFEWDGNAWQREQPSGPKPSPRGGKPVMTYDPAHRLVLLYGGWDQSGARGDLWSWDGAHWQLLEGDGGLR